jgi:enoyl-CoA hydratase/carnithine racemase
VDDSTPLLRDTRADGVQWLTFNRPQRLNSFTVPDYRDLRVALEECAADDGTRVVVITGAGRAFSSGADRSLLDGSMSGAERSSAGAEFGQLLEVLAAFPKPLIACVNGLAIGIGSTMLPYCDLVLVAESARLRFPFTAMGIVPEAASSTLLLSRGRLPEVTWAMLSSEWIEAEKAVEMGLAWRVVADAQLADASGEAASTIAALPPPSVVATKRLLTVGRTELMRATTEREMEEMRSLLDRPGPGGPFGA